MNECPSFVGAEKLEDLVLQNIVPEGNECRGSCIYDEYALSFAHSLDEHVEFLLVNYAPFKHLQVLSEFSATLRSGSGAGRRTGYFGFLPAGLTLRNSLSHL